MSTVNDQEEMKYDYSSDDMKYDSDVKSETDDNSETVHSPVSSSSSSSSESEEHEYKFFTCFNKKKEEKALIENAEDVEERREQLEDKYKQEETELASCADDVMEEVSFGKDDD